MCFAATPARSCRRCSFSADVKVRGALAGNGGKMALAKPKLRTCDANKKTGRTTKNNTREGTVRKWAGKDGAELLHEAADRRVGQNSEKLADLLTQKALEGDLASTKTLVGYAERKKPKPEPVKKRRGPSMAERWAAEPEWKGEEEAVEEI